MMENPIIEEDRIRFDGLEIMILTENSSALEGRDDIYYMAKSAPYLGSYAQVRDVLTRTGAAHNLMEIGVFRGGSTPYLHRFFGARSMSCVDRVSAVIPLDRYVKEVAPAVRVQYSTDQSDKAALKKIVSSDFTSAVDLIVDDASHLYGPTKSTFEALFPYLRVGGIYVIEDWDWSHSQGAQSPEHYWWNQLSLSNLIFELVAAYGNGTSGLISSINFAPGLMWVVKGWRALGDDFALDDFTGLRGRTLNLV